MDYLADDKLQEFKLNREGNDEIEPVSDLMISGAAYGDTAKAYRNFKSEHREVKFAGEAETNESFPNAEERTLNDRGGDDEGDDDESAEDNEAQEENDLGRFGVVEDDLSVDDEEFLDLADQFLALAMDTCSGSE